MDVRWLANYQFGIIQSSKLRCAKQSAVYLIFCEKVIFIRPDVAGFCAFISQGATQLF